MQDDKTVPDETIAGTVGAVNAHLASRAGVLITPAFSAWSVMLRTLMQASAPGVRATSLRSSADGAGSALAGGAGTTLSFCCKCSPREKRARVGNVHVILSALLPPQASRRVRAALRNASGWCTGGFL